jgi:hypothetical protein
MKFEFRHRFIWTVGAIASFFLVADARAATIILDAIQDTWVSQNTTLNTTGHNNLLLEVRGGSNSSTSSTTTKRYTVIEFDLSGVTDEITGATLQLYMLPDTASAANAGTTTTIAVAYPLTSHIDEETLSWSGANPLTTRADMGPAEVAMSNLGRFTYSGTGAVTTGQYYAGDAGSAGDVTFVEGRRNSAEKLIGFLLNPNSTNSAIWHQWSDHESGFAPQLVLTTVPEPSCLLIACVAIPIAFTLCRRVTGTG